VCVCVYIYINVGKYSFINRTIQSRNHLPAGLLESHCDFLYEINSSVNSREMCVCVCVCVCVCIYSLMLFVVDNTHYFLTHPPIHKINIRYKNQLHVPSIRLSTVQTANAYSAIKIFNKLPLRISGLKNNTIIFKFALRKYLLEHVFYSIQEFLSTNEHLFTLRKAYFLISSCSSIILTTF
jgi:hypothetical protein